MKESGLAGALASPTSMDLHPLTMDSKCVADDETLTAHVQSALARGLPVLGQHVAHDIVAVLVGSGPSVAGYVDALRRQRAKGRPIFAMNEAHDWLMRHGVEPDYAVAIDPSDHVLRWFAQASPRVKYFIASQCHPHTLDYLHDCPVWLFHLNFNKGKAFPPNTPLINGCTTTGLRAMTLLYTMGFRRFELYGYDSCLMDGVLRVNGDQPAPGSLLAHVVVGPRHFLCTPGMAAQASEFQHLFTMMPDIAIQAYGDGVLTAILAERQQARLMEAVA